MSQGLLEWYARHFSKPLKIVVFLPLRQGGRCITKRSSLACFFVGGRSHYQCFVVHDSNASKGLSKQLLLCLSRIESIFVRLNRHLDALLLLNVRFNLVEWGTACGANEVAVRPQGWQSRFQISKLLSQKSTASAFNLLYNSMDSVLGIDFNKKMHMVRHYFHFGNNRPTFAANLSDYLFEPCINTVNQNATSILRAPDDVINTVKNNIVIGLKCHTHSIQR